MRAKEIMVPVTQTVSPASTVRDALNGFRSTRLMGIPVVDRDGLLTGMFTRINLYDCLLRGAGLNDSIEPYYLREVISLPEDKNFNTPSELTRWLRNVSIGQTPLVDAAGRPSGMLTQAYAVNYLLDHIELLYEELSNILQQAPCGILATDGEGVINLVSTYLQRILPAARLGERIKDVLPGIPFDEIVDGVWLGPRKVKHRSQVLLVNGLPIIQDREVKGVVLILQDAAEIDAVIKHPSDEDKQQELSFTVKARLIEDELYKLNGTKYTIENIIGNSPAIQEIKRKVLQIAQTPSTVLVTGESGTGKEIIVQAVHNASDRFKRPFVKINCAAIPLELAESELFGYEGGGFTGALRHGKPGKFEIADGGTLFLDEIGDMPLPLQGKLLRVIQEREVERVGGIKAKKIDVRIIAATNKDLYKLCKEEKFRKDLLYRLEVLVLNAPPLREHLEDVSPLVYYFVDKFHRKLNKRVVSVNPEVMDYINKYAWPGNVRELENMIHRAVIYAKTDSIQMEDLGIDSRDFKYVREGGLALSDVAREAIIRALEATNGNKSQAAKLLGISRATLYDKLRSVK
ncbi:MAG TPA: sigma 54-interacting transcriptional regulator [Spirochaetia bacterium]|nr:sigma 54-interacting transcriptional regulator [Spirochaetia bacterium]